MRGMALAGILILILSILGATRHYYNQSVCWEEKAKDASAAASQYKSEIKLLQSQQKKLAELDAQYTEKLNEAEQKNTDLRAQLAVGHRRMLIAGHGKCAHRAAPPTGSLGDDGTIELSADTGQHILSIREGIIRDQQKVMYLQSYIRQFCLR